MKRRLFLVRLLLPAAAALLAGCAVRPPLLPRETWDDPAVWQVRTNSESTASLAAGKGQSDPGLQLTYSLGGGHGWVELNHSLSNAVPGPVPFRFSVRAEGAGDLEIKLVDADGSVFGRRIPLTGQYGEWTRLVLYPETAEYWWGGNDDGFTNLAAVQIAVARAGRGTLWLDELGLDQPGIVSTFPPCGPVLDPDRERPGIGFRQRRASEMIPEDPLVLEWLRQIQDGSSPDRAILPSMENNEAHTFNNALAAMAFLIKGEKERAERILDFFARATRRDNDDPTLQNFFYKGEARGFFQAVALNPTGTVAAYHTAWANDRWMGDLAWLLIAYKHYERRYGPDRYREISGLLLDLLRDWYKDAEDGPGGYVQHGWRRGDQQLHEGHGHPEGNIDCYAVFRMCGDTERADQIRAWLDRVLRGNGMPLDLYTWRVLAYGSEALHLLDIPEYDLRYRKTLAVRGQPVAGLFDHADISVTNSWLDGVGHIACAYLDAGNPERGMFYANQLDPFLIDRVVNGVPTRSLPYVANNSGYDWVELDKGFVSVASWYIFAKNRFNPLRLGD